MSDDDLYILRRTRHADGSPIGYMFWCPGCKCGHGVATDRTNPAANWTFNGDMEKPTFSPSVLVDKDRPERRCHLYVRDGQIQFLNDCHHGLRGQSVPMEPF